MDMPWCGVGVFVFVFVFVGLGGCVPCLRLRRRGRPPLLLRGPRLCLFPFGSAVQFLEWLSYFCGKVHR